MVREALYMEEAVTLVTSLLVLCTAIEVSIAQGTLEIY